MYVTQALRCHLLWSKALTELLDLVLHIVYTEEIETFQLPLARNSPRNTVHFASSRGLSHTSPPWGAAAALGCWTAQCACCGGTDIGTWSFRFDVDTLYKFTFVYSERRHHPFVATDCFCLNNAEGLSRLSICRSSLWFSWLNVEPPGTRLFATLAWHIIKAIEAHSAIKC